MSRSSFEGFPQPKKDNNGTKTGDATATAPDIIALKTAYGPLGKIVGTMPYYPSQNKLQVVVFGNTTAGRLYLQGPDGFYQGSTVYADEANFIAANIPYNMSMFGLVGTGANAKRYANGTLTTGSVLTAINLDSGAQTNEYIASVSGLNFPNGIGSLRIYNPANTVITIYSSAQLGSVSSTSKVFYDGKTVGTGQIARVAGAITISTTSFQMPVSVASLACNWEAWEA